MTAITAQDFTTYQGDDVYPIFTVYGSDLTTVVDISTVAQIEWFARRQEDDANVLSKLKSAGQIAFVTNGTDGKFQVTITKTDTAALNGYYLHYARTTDASGNITTIECGRLRVGPRPSWTYDPSSIATNEVYQVRRLIGDVIASDPQFYDAEIAFAISQRATTMAAAADLCRQLAAQYSRQVDVTTPGGLSTSNGQKARTYLDMAREFEDQAKAQGAGIAEGVYMGGISRADKSRVQSNTDRVQPSFNIGMQDNFIVPGPQVGNEVPVMPQGIATGGGP